jgi:hypothetical protein
LWLLNGKKRFPYLLLLAEEAGRSKKTAALRCTQVLSDCIGSF